MNSQKESKSESLKMPTHPPSRLGEVLLELLRNCGVDVPLALLPGYPAVLKGIAENRKMIKVKVKKLRRKLSESGSDRTTNYEESEGKKGVNIERYFGLNTNTTILFFFLLLFSNRFRNVIICIYKTQ